MKSSTVNISFSDDLLRKIDQVAREESRSRSELIREAARGYIERKRRWKQIFDFGKMNAARKGIAESDIETEIAAYRRVLRSLMTE
jgi:metal-responsive CopG/Arc/MetJ family transcriptional regulator